MAKSKIPGPLERRHLIERNLAPDRALAIAEAYLQDGRSVEAVDFLAKANALDRLEALRREAIEAGDVFVFRAAAQGMQRPPDREEWRSLAKAAARLGKDRYALEATRQADRGED
ncbi:MAG: hypothetical protein OEM49_15585 [Myxococcales bacterium]|nr:hypothetical protein [Myxococcales bacterium]MDH5567741.1 hypothetical protein [Myxococcales bacterium]